MNLIISEKFNGFIVKYI